MAKKKSLTHYEPSEVVELNIYLENRVDGNKWFRVELNRDEANSEWVAWRSNGGIGGNSAGPFEMARGTDYDVVREVAEDKLAAKLKERYSEVRTDGGAQLQAPTASTGERVPFVPWLPNEIKQGDARLNIMLLSENYWMQKKYNGVFFWVWKDESGVHGANKNGTEKGMPTAVAEYLKSLAAINFAMCGEMIGDVFYAHDLVRHVEVAIDMEPYSERLALLTALLGTKQDQAIRLVETAKTPAEKAEMIDRLHGEGAEGYILKRTDGAYIWKIKFWKHGHFKVMRDNAPTRSVNVGVLVPNDYPRGKNIKVLTDGTVWRDMGSVTIYPDQDVPAVDAILEVRYLYAQDNLVQPKFLFVNEDKTFEDCGIDRVEFLGTR